jgi:hypothetical protein
VGRTPDRQVGPSIEEEQQWEDRGPAGDNDGDPTVEGAMRRVTNVIRYFVNGAVSQIARWKNPPANFDDVDLAGITNGQGLAYNAANFQFEPQTFAGGYDSITHRDEDQLVHCVMEDSHVVVTRTGFLVTNVTTWTDISMVLKIREVGITYTGYMPNVVTTTQYNAAGVAVEIVVETIGYTGYLTTSIARDRTL